MMKFFRKHMKKLLAIFASAILISWLGGSALQSLLTPDMGGSVTATYVGGDITRNQWRWTQRQTAWLDGLRLNWRYPASRAQLVDLDQPSWFLLQKEAQRMGIHSSRPLVETMLENHLKQLRRQKIPVPSVASLAAKLNVTQELIYDAVAAHIDVVRYVGKVGQAAAVSDAEVLRALDDGLSQVQFKAAVLRAEMFENPEETFTESEMRETFDKSKDRKPSGKGMNFGYVLPPRVKMQYAKIDPKAIEQAVTLDPRKLEDEANEYWRKNKQDPAFLRPPGEKKDDTATTRQADEDTTTQPTSAPAEEGEKEKSPYFANWLQAREAAIEAVRSNKATERAEAIANWLKEQTAIPWDHLEANTNGYKPTPAIATATGHYSQILGDATVGLSGVETVTISTTDWISPENIQDLEGIGSALLPNPGGQPIMFPQIVFHVEGLAVIPSGEDAVGVDRTTFMALYQTYPYAMRDADDNIYVFRPVQVGEERPPLDIDEVRDRVVADLRFAHGYEKAQTAAKELHQKARQDGLENAWNVDKSIQKAVNSFNETTDDQARKAGFNKIITVNRKLLTGDPVEYAGNIGQVTETFLEACFTMGQSESKDSRLRIIDMPESGTVVVVEWIKDVPLDEQRFEMFKSYVSQQMQRQRVQEYLGEWLRPKQIKARNEFEPVIQK
ncbi:MAG: hypothetical protein KAV00_08895 [Phycisphaerae bacterium]|nr:hypothetical protein [Phycisphaerae bacterium]